MPRPKKAIFIGGFWLLLLAGAYLSAALWPVKQDLLVGEHLDLSPSLPSFLRSQVRLQLHGTQVLWREGSLDLQAGSPGHAKVQLRLQGFLPLRTLVLEVHPTCQVFPGGQSVGVLLYAQGLLVAGFADVLEGQHYSNPASAAGIRRGDLILAVDGQPVTGAEALKQAVERAGKEGRALSFQLKRNGRRLKVEVRPSFCQRTRSHRVGLLVQEATAGVGTLTFYDPCTRKYGALGHPITERWGTRPADLAEGRVVEAHVREVRRGEKGQPGEKIGVLAPAAGFRGNIKRNTIYGVFGYLEKLPSHPFYPNPIPVASSSQVHPGRAELLTVIEDGRLECFQTEIVRVNRLGSHQGKDIMIRVVDERLLRVTGGIVQGMSGSPLIQDGRLVGAVTHVLVSRPECGYAVLAERMLKECELLPVPTSFRWENFLSGWKDKISPRRIIWKGALNEP
ncbi:SpoIVB peptidase [Desulfothermobacter acidiphilus]|uniref:SpoIVB peptidase n=1 Tax=Desulfothermobacter acidiphilus TaxID=1938353 RepID=UPI003F88C425